MLHIKWKYYTKIVIPPYRPFEWKLSEMKQKSICQSNNDNNVDLKSYMEHNLKYQILKATVKKVMS